MHTKSNITICIPTNFVPSSPGTSLVEYTINNLFAKVPELKECPLVISCDVHPEKNGEAEHEYVRNLEKLASTQVRVISAESNQGQRTSFLNLAANVETKYMLNFEHDWVFAEHIPFDQLLDVMEKYEDVNFIAFNKTRNFVRGTDYVLEPATDITEIPLLRSARYSNNPHLSRKSFWDVKLRKILSDPKPLSGNLNFAIEVPVFGAYRRDIGRRGFAAAHKDWGIFVYGEMEHPPTIKHVNGKKFKG